MSEDVLQKVFVISDSLIFDHKICYQQGRISRGMWWYVTPPHNFLSRSNDFLYINRICLQANKKGPPFRKKKSTTLPTAKNNLRIALLLGTPSQSKNKDIMKAWMYTPTKNLMCAPVNQIAPITGYSPNLCKRKCTAT